MTMNGHVDTMPPGDTMEEQIANTWRAGIVNSNLYVELHTELLLVNVKLHKIMSKLGIADVALPPMREEMPSSASLEKMIPRVAEAAARGEREPGTDAATEVRRVLEEEKSKEEARANARRLAQIDSDADKAKADRKKFWLTTVSAVTGGLGLAGAIELVKWLGSLHH